MTDGVPPVHWARAAWYPVLLEGVFPKVNPLSGCVNQGKTHDEAIANIREAIALCAEVRAEEGLPVSIETIQVDVAV